MNKTLIVLTWLGGLFYWTACQEAKTEHKPPNFQSLKTLNFEGLDTSPIQSNPACQALREEMNRLRTEHASFNENLQDVQKSLKLCLRNQPDRAIGQGACSHWEEQANSFRAYQEHLYQRFEDLKTQLGKNCQ